VAEISENGVLQFKDCKFKGLEVLREEDFGFLRVFESDLIDDSELGNMLDDGKRLFLGSNLFGKVGQFIGINHGDNCKDFIIFKVMEVGEYNMAEDVIRKGKLE
jgi:hypothetical protein